MNERVPDSSGLPLRAMVMVLLFLGGIFLLVAIQNMVSDGGSGDQAAATTTSSSATATSEAPSSSAEPAPKADVRVYNISEIAGAAARVSDLLTEQHWTVTETGNLAELVGSEGPPELPGVTVDTVYWGPTEGEQQAAEQIGELLHAPVAERTPEIAHQPPGVIVVVTG